MNLPRAIEILQDLPLRGQQISFEKRLDACNLGIEALKRQKEYRECDFPNIFALLPGETEEGG